MVRVVYYVKGTDRQIVRRAPDHMPSLAATIHDLPLTTAKYQGEVNSLLLRFNQG